MSLNQTVKALEILNWNETLKKVYKKVWHLLRTRLGKPLVINGEVITKDDFNFDAEITPTGSAEALDKFTQLQKALQRVQMIIQQVQLGLIANFVSV